MLNIHKVIHKTICLHYLSHQCVCEKPCLSLCATIQHPLHTSNKLRLCCHCWHLKDSLLWDYMGSTPEAVWLFFFLCSLHQQKGKNIIVRYCFFHFFWAKLNISICCNNSQPSLHSVHAGWDRSQPSVHQMGLAGIQWAFTITHSAPLNDFCCELIFLSAKCQWNRLFCVGIWVAQNDHQRHRVLHYFLFF